MLEADQFKYQPHAAEFEKASYAYLLGILALAVGLPIPIINFLAGIFYYLSARKETEFVRWHALQEAILQFTMLIINSIHIAWLLSLVMSPLLKFVFSALQARRARSGREAGACSRRSRGRA